MAVDTMRLRGCEELCDQLAADTSTPVVRMHIQLVEAEILFSLPEHLLVHILADCPIDNADDEADHLRVVLGDPEIVAQARL